MQRDGNLSFLPARSACLDVALKAREEGHWVQTVKWEADSVGTAVGMLGEVAVRRKTPRLGAMLAL